jgi:hypothetical protein
VQVLIARGELDSYFWVNLLLTLLAWLPGVAHALWVLCSRNPLARELRGLLAVHELLMPCMQWGSKHQPRQNRAAGSPVNHSAFCR